MTRTAPPRRRDAVKTKAAILSAARMVFSAKGFAQTGIRDIAAEAGVSSTLLLRYFGSKAGLFQAALTESMQVGTLFDGARAEFGSMLARLFIDDAVEINAPSMIALSTGSAEARDIATQAIADHVLGPLADWLGAPNARERALQIMVLAMGFVLFLRQLPVMNSAQMSKSAMTTWFASAVQDIVDQSKR